MAVPGTKLRVPLSRRQLVDRSRLTDRLPTSGGPMPRLVLVAAPVTILLANLIASYPGWRASRLRPAEQLRHE